MRLMAALFCAFAISCGGHDDAAPGSGSDATLYFSAIPDQETTELKEKFGKVAKYLSEQLGIKAEYRHASDYGASVEMFKNGDVHLAWFGGLSGCQARAAVPGARAIAQGVEDPKFISYFIAHKSTGLKPGKEFPAALADLTFAFGSEKSTSGRLMPEYYIKVNTGKSPREFFKKKFIFSGSHDKTIDAVASGTVQAGVLNFKVYNKRVAKDIDKGDVPIIWTTPPYADYNWTAHPDLEKMFGAGFIDKLQKVLVDCTDKDVLDAFQRDDLVEAKNADFAGIADVAKSLNLLR